MWRPKKDVTWKSISSPTIRRSWRRWEMRRSINSAKFNTADDVITSCLDVIKRYWGRRSLRLRSLDVGHCLTLASLSTPVMLRSWSLMRCSTLVFLARIFFGEIWGLKRRPRSSRFQQYKSFELKYWMLLNLSVICVREAVSREVSGIFSNGLIFFPEIGWQRSCKVV